MSPKRAQVSVTRMAPDPGVRTVGCALAKLVPDANVLADIQTSVERAQVEVPTCRNYIKPLLKISKR